jgi:hypothetical protein
MLSSHDLGQNGNLVKIHPNIVQTYVSAVNSMEIEEEGQRPGARRPKQKI